MIDTTENCQVMEQIIEDLIAKIGKPTKIAAMIYTHFHTDHTAGGGAVLRLASEIKERESTSVLYFSKIVVLYDFSDSKTYQHYE